MEILHVTEANFDSQVLQEDKPVLADFWVTWCGPCQMQAPILEELAKERDDVIIAKVDVDQNPNLAQKYRVMSIPCWQCSKTVSRWFPQWDYRISDVERDVESVSRAAGLLRQEREDVNLPFFYLLTNTPWGIWIIAGRGRDKKTGKDKMTGCKRKMEEKTLTERERKQPGQENQAGKEERPCPNCST